MISPRLLRNAYFCLVVLVAATLAVLGVQHLADGGLLAVVRESGGDPLFYIGNAYAANAQIRAGEISILQLLRKEILVDTIYWPFGRYITGVDADLPFLMLVLASNFVSPTVEGVSLTYNSVLALNGVLNCAAIYLVLRELKVRSVFLMVTASIMWMAFPFYRTVVALGHLGFLPFWPLLLAVTLGLSSLSKAQFDIWRPVAVGLCLYLTASSSLQYAYFLALASIPVAGAILLQVRRGAIPVPNIRRLFLYLSISGSVALFLMLLFPLHNNYADSYGQILSEIRVASRPIADLAYYAVSPLKFVEKGGMWYVGAGFVVLVLLSLALFRLNDNKYSEQRIPFLILGATSVSLLALAVSTNAELSRSFLYAISPSARVYARALGIAIPLMLVMVTMMLDRAWAWKQSRPFLIASLLFVFVIDLNFFSKSATTDLSRYVSQAHVNANRSILGDQVIADFTPIRTVAYQAYAPFWNAALTGQKTGIALDCKDPLFVNTFLYYGGTTIIDKDASPVTCGNAPSWASKIVAEQKFADGSRITRLRPGAVQALPREIWREGMSPTIYSNQMWFPMVDLGQKATARKVDPGAVGGYRYSWRRGNTVDSSYECKEPINTNPLALSADEAGNVVGWFVGKPVYIALQPLTCAGIRTPGTPGDYSLDLEIDMPGIHTRVNLKVNVVES